MSVAVDDGTVSVQLPGPSFLPKEGTLGTLIKIAGSGFTGKSPSVKISGTSCKVLKPWTDTELQCQVVKALGAGTYDVTLQLSKKDPVASLGSFTFKNPVIDEIQPGSGSVGSTIRAIGKYFSNKKPQVYLEDPVTLKRKTCKISGWTMDPVTGASTVDFTIPKTTSGSYNVLLKNSVGEAKKSFTVN
ncbi:MAG: hypothetical protein EHM36_03140 [Deltaproteobacteria bacterium]|nr:MAG: hypothetical protein EHM36_03140 [Deltaproteobacteria bacterium]